MIANPTFDESGSSPGMAMSWTLRTRVQREAIAGFDAPNEHGGDSFELWSDFEGDIAPDAPRSFFALAGVESFEVGWTYRTFVDALDAAMVVAAIFDASVYEHFDWGVLLVDWDRATTSGRFADSLETAWRNDAFVTRFDDAAAVANVFAESVAIESFEGAWPMIGRA